MPMSYFVQRKDGTGITLFYASTFDGFHLSILTRTSCRQTESALCCLSKMVDRIFEAQQTAQRINTKALDVIDLQGNISHSGKII